MDIFVVLEKEQFTQYLCLVSSDLSTGKKTPNVGFMFWGWLTVLSEITKPRYFVNGSLNTCSTVPAKVAETPDLWSLSDSSS